MSKSTDNKKLLAAAISRKKQLALANCFDPGDVNSEPTPIQLNILKDMATVRHRYVVAGNQSGKSLLAARELAWLFSDTHPFFKYPPKWVGNRLLFLVVGKVGSQIEEELWENKIKRFLLPGTYKEVRQGGTLQKVVHRKNGNTILFTSHDANKKSQDRLQGFVANYVWLDEMPPTFGILEECHRRIQSLDGRFIATFTPKTKNDKIRKLVDRSDGEFAKKYKMSMLDNPTLSQVEKDRIILSMASYTDAYKNTILYGDWSGGENLVYNLDMDLAVETPEGYHPGWRHLEVVDPALSSKLGFALLAENPASGVWYVVKAEYVTDIYVPTKVVQAVQKKVEGVNITKRVSDSEPWYVNTASSIGVTYQGVYNKNSRKAELIKGLQERLIVKIKIAPWCTDLIEEFNSCQWAEDVEGKIVNRSSFHLLDCLQYAADSLPKMVEFTVGTDWHSQLRAGNEKRKKREAEAKKSRIYSGGRLRRRKVWS